MTPKNTGASLSIAQPIWVIQQVSNLLGFPYICHSDMPIQPHRITMLSTFVMQCNTVGSLMPPEKDISGHWELVSGKSDSIAFQK